MFDQMYIACPQKLELAKEQQSGLSGSYFCILNGWKLYPTLSWKCHKCYGLPQ